MILVWNNLQQVDAQYRNIGKASNFIVISVTVYINVRENRRGNQNWKIHKHRKHRTQDTETEKYVYRYC